VQRQGASQTWPSCFSSAPHFVLEAHSQPQNYHGLSLGVPDCFFRHLVHDAFTDGSGGRPVLFDHLGVFVLNVHAEVGEGLVDQKFGMSFLHYSVKLTRGLVSRNSIREA
jgi:hypothetical protein